MLGTEGVIIEEGNLVTGGAYSMSLTERLDIEEGEDLFGFKELEGGDVSCQESVNHFKTRSSSATIE
jgi:hypothetical protein